MNMQNRYDLIVIGAGAGGLNVASFANSVGLRVLLIDKSVDRIGGDCLNAGCVPSKALIHVARLYRSLHEVKQFGATSDGVVSMPAVIDYIKKTQSVIREHENADYFRQKGMSVVFGEASFVGTHAIMVAGTEYYGRRIVIATGSRPRSLTIPGVDAVKLAGRLHTNETIFDLGVLPARLLVIGGGPIGVELGQAFAHLGSCVTIVTHDTRILPREDQDISRALESALVKEGVTVLCNQTAVRFEQGSMLVASDDTTGEETSILFDHVLVAIGRDVNITPLQPEKASIAVSAQGVPIVDQYLRTTNKRIFVCGDAVGQHQFTHAAELHASVIIKNLFTPFFKTALSTDTVSAVTYTTPEIATYGFSEFVLKQRRIPYEVLSASFTESDRAITDNETAGYTKMFVHAKTKQILGGTMAANNAGELIQELILATTEKLSTTALFNKIYPYPTATRINKQLVIQGERRRLTKLVKRLLKSTYRLMG
jgi:pyruvate/2-oxoglutarate dehydrogenase complex dihydrolipoamide dehydrogenase (E3) component